MVRINGWEKESQYPNGHIVQTLGEIGDLETEVQTLLIEHDVFVGEFPQNVVMHFEIQNVNVILLYCYIYLIFQEINSSWI